MEQFYSLFTKGIEAWIEAGKLVSAQLEEDADFAEKVRKSHPEISEDTIYAFDRIGRRELHPKLILSDAPGVRKVRRLSYAQQCKLVETPVPLLIKSDKGWDTLNVSIFNLTSEQANQIFDGDGIRHEGAQRAWLENRATKAVVHVDQPYRVAGNKLVVLEPCQFTMRQLVSLMAQME